jgi:hypothetical protein
VTRWQRSRLWATIFVVACGSDVGPPAPVASVTVTPAVTPLSAGATVQLTAVPKDANGTPLSGRIVIWSSNDPAVASVDGSGLVSGKTPGAVRITASSEGKSGSADVNVSPGPANRLAFTVQPTTTGAGSPITPAVQVSVRDVLGNAATGFTGNVTIGIGANPVGGTLAGTKTVAAVAGVADFGDLSIDKASTGYTLSAVSPGLSGTTSSAFTIITGGISPGQSSITALPATITASGGASLATITVTARDDQGNRVAGASVVLVATGSGNTLTQPTGTTDAAGMATGTLSSTEAGTKILSVTIAGVVVAQTDTVTVTPAAVAALAFAVQPSDAVAGATIAPVVEVEIQDAFGNRVTSATHSVTVAILANPSGGTLSGTKTVSAVSGVAAFSLLSIELAGTGYTLAASATGITGATSNDFSITPGTASRLVFFAEPSNVVAGATITPAVQIEIQDAFGNRVPTATTSITLAFAANPSGGTLSGSKSRAAVAGVATFDNLSIDTAGVGYRLRGTATGLTPDTSVAFSVMAGAATQLVFTREPSSTAATVAITPGVQVTARDALGNTAVGFSGSVTVAIGTNGGGGALSGITTVAAVSGMAVYSTLSIDGAGTGYTLTATATGLAGATSTPFNITVGAAAGLSFLVQPPNASGGGTLSPAVQVEILDAGGNRVTSASTSVSLTLTSNPSSGTLSGTNPVAAVNGVATFANLSIDSAGAGYTLAASATGLTGATSAGFDISVGSAAKLAFVVQPSNTSGGAAIAPAVQVEVQDAGGNRVSIGTYSVVLGIASNPGSGTLSGTPQVSSTGGRATFADVSINNAGAGYTLSASSSGLSAATSSSFDIIVGTATKLAFLAQPTSTTGGMPIGPAVTVEIQDAGGNRVTDATNGVTIGIGANPNSGTLSGTTTVAAASGLATFSTLTIDSAGIGYAFTASAAGLVGAASTAFNVIVGPPAQLAFRIHPTTTAGGAIITPAIQVEVRDAGGNHVVGAANTVTVGITSNPNDGTLSGTKSAAAVAGVATFGTLHIDSAGIGYRLGATALGLSGATSNAFNITVGVPARLGFHVHPSSTAAGASITPPVEVEIQDAGGNRVTTATNSVTVALAANPGSSTLSGSSPKSGVGGVATFANLSLNKTGTGYTLRATSGSLVPDTSAAFNVTPDGVDAGLSSLAAATDTIGQCAYSCVPGIHASTVTVTVKDQFGNPGSGSPVVLSASGTGNAFSPSASGNADASGVFTAAFNSAVTGAKTISATAGGAAITQTAAAVVMPVLVGAGDIADCNSIRDDATANLLDSIPGVVFTAGDNAYPNGRTQDYADCYDPTWGRHKSRTRPVVGNHEYDSSGTAAPYFAYFGAAVADSLGNGFGYYSFDLGTWHVVVLNSDSGSTSGAGAGQLSWLQSDLVGRTNQCVLAIWHRALFTSGASNGGAPRIRRLWAVLEDAGAEVIINGHDHLYERFAPQDSLGNATPAGVREFIAGTGGGALHTSYVTHPTLVEASDEGNFTRGVLRLILYANSYRWEFLPAQDQGTYSDVGLGTCH